MFKFIGVMFTLSVILFAILYFGGYIHGKAEIGLTQEGKQAIISGMDGTAQSVKEHLKK